MAPKDKHPIKPLTTSFQITEANAAKYWGLLPWDFDQLTAEKKGRLVALYVVNREIEYYYHKEGMRDIDKAGSNRPGGNKMIQPKNFRR